MSANFCADTTGGNNFKYTYINAFRESGQALLGLALLAIFLKRAERAVKEGVRLWDSSWACFDGVCALDVRPQKAHHRIRITGFTDSNPLATV